MRKYIFSLIIVLALSLSALYIFETKQVNAQVLPAYDDDIRAEVIFQLTAEQIALGITWVDGSTEDKYYHFDNYNGFYDIIEGSLSTYYLYPNRGFMPGSVIDKNVTNQFQAFVKIIYDGLPRICNITNFSQTAWFNDLYVDSIDISEPFIFRFNFYEDDLDAYFTYKDTATTTRTDYGIVIRSWSLGENATNPEWTNGNLQPPSFENAIFTGWKIGNTTYSYTELLNYYPKEDFTAVAQYVTSSQEYTVNFYDGLNLIDSKLFVTGVGAIVPGSYSFGVGQTLLGWSLRLGGSILNLSTFNLTEDIDLYAVKEFNSNSTVNGGEFEIPYRDCSTFDIPCHLGNAVVYFLNEFPLISDVASFIFPVGDFLLEFPQYFEVFEGLGLIFVFSMGIMLICFIFRFMR